MYTENKNKRNNEHKIALEEKVVCFICINKNSELLWYCGIYVNMHKLIREDTSIKIIDNIF